MHALALAISLLAAELLAAPQSPQILAVSVVTKAGDHVVLRIASDDRAPVDVAAASALIVNIDGREAQHVLLIPGSGPAAYETLLGPLDAGTHRITLTPSTLWPWSKDVTVRTANATVVRPADASNDLAVISHAPTLGMRADTIGTASDLPLVMYAEDLRKDGKGWIRYTVILSNEDGGTPAPALMARWGRTTDIELVYEVDLDGDRIVQERLQGPDHEMRAVRGPREGQHPYLLFATLNNMVMDRGRSVAAVRLVPQRVSLEGRTRESVMDDHPWTYRVMARELVAEKHIGTDLEDPREFLFVEAKLTVENAAVSVQAGSEAIGWKDSSRGRSDLMVSRNEWVRIATVAAPDALSLRWNCQARAGDATRPARCAIEWTRAFRLGRDYLPGPNLIQPGRVELGAGLSEPVALRSTPAGR
jgi:hypothetical protein